MQIAKTFFIPGIYLAYHTYQKKYQAKTAEQQQHLQSTTQISTFKKISELASQFIIESFSVLQNKQQPSPQQMQQGKIQSNEDNILLDNREGDCFQIEQFLNNETFIRVLKEVTFFGALGITSLCVAKYMRKTVRYTDFKNPNAIQNIILGKGKLNQKFLDMTVQTDLNSLNVPDGQIVYGKGQVKINLLNNQLLEDPVFGLKASSSDVLELQRKVQVFKNHNKNKDWIDVSQLRQFYPNQYEPYMQESFFLPEHVKLGQYELYRHFYLEPLSGDQSQMKIDQKQVNEHFQKLMANKEKYWLLTNYQNDNYLLNKQSEPISEKYIFANHPFRFTNNRKQIVFQNDYIYIVQDMNNFQDGDMRISFHEIKPVLEASVIALKQGNSLVQNTFDHINNRDLGAELCLGGRFNKKKLRNIGIIQKGVVNKYQLIQQLVDNLYIEDNKLVVDNGKYKEGFKEKFNKQMQRILAMIIFIFYINLTDELELNNFTWGIGLTGTHITTTLLYKYGLINPSTFLAVIASTYFIANVKSPVNSLQHNSQNQIYEPQILDHGILNEDHIRFMQMIDNNNKLQK